MVCKFYSTRKFTVKLKILALVNKVNKHIFALAGIVDEQSHEWVSIKWNNEIVYIDDSIVRSTESKYEGKRVS